MRKALGALVVVGALVAACTPEGRPDLPRVVAGAYSSPDLGHTFGNAVWNRPVAGMPLHADSAEYVSRLYHYGRLGGGDAVGQFQLLWNDFAQPVFDAKDAPVVDPATGAQATIRVMLSNHGIPGNLPNPTYVPWNGNWRPPEGKDKTVHIVDSRNGRVWELWETQDDNLTDCNFTVLAPTEPTLCVGKVDLIRDAAGNPVDYHTYEGGFPTGGAYLPDLAMLTTAYEVKSGHIPHALQAIIYNTMFGPECTPAQRATTAAGTTCGFFEHPAGHLEHSPESRIASCDNPLTPLDVTDAGRATTVPEGMRFALKPDVNIDAWLDAKGYQDHPDGTKGIRSLAKVFAQAMKEYGFVVTNTSCGASNFLVTGLSDPETAKVWEEAGLPPGGNTDVLYGLITPDNVVALAPSEALPLGCGTPVCPTP